MGADYANRWLTEAKGRARTYDERWEEMAAQGENVHGEADLVMALQPRSVLDAGCGTGRVAVELARRGVDVVGVDLDGSMLDQARAKAPDVPWVEGDLATVDLGRTFDLVLLAGNVMIYLTPGTEGIVVANLARHLRPSPRSGGRSGPSPRSGGRSGPSPRSGGRSGPSPRSGGHLVAGFQLQPDRLDLDTYDAHAAAAGLVLAERWATWDRLPFAGGDYAVSVHRTDG